MSPKYRNSVVQQHSTFVQQDEYVSKATTEVAEISESMASTVQLVQSSTDVIDSSNISSLPATPISSTSMSSSSSSGLPPDQLHQFSATLDSSRKSKRNRFKTKCEQPKYEFFLLFLFCIMLSFIFYHSFFFCNMI